MDNVLEKQKIINKVHDKSVHDYEIIRDMTDELLVNVGADNFREGHYHKQIELLFVISGNIAVIINNVKYSLTSGDIVVVNPFEHHEYLESNAITMVVCISARYGDQFLTLANNCKFRSNILHKCQDTDKLLALAYELKSSLKENDFIIASHILALLGELVNAIGLESSVNTADIVYKVKDYISRNYASEINLDVLSNYCNINKFYISREFNKKFGYSISDYVNLTRLNEFTKKYRSKSCNISEIALEVGFSSTRSFYNAFKKHYKVTPKEYLLVKND